MSRVGVMRLAELAFFDDLLETRVVFKDEVYVGCDHFEGAAGDGNDIGIPICGMEGKGKGG